MPNYEYKCGDCGLLVPEWRDVNNRNDPMPCINVECHGGVMRRSYVSPANVQYKGSGWHSKDYK